MEPYFLFLRQYTINRDRCGIIFTVYAPGKRQREGKSGEFRVSKHDRSSLHSCMTCIRVGSCSRWLPTPASGVRVCVRACERACMRACVHACMMAKTETPTFSTARYFSTYVRAHRNEASPQLVPGTYLLLHDVLLASTANVCTSVSARFLRCCALQRSSGEEKEEKGRRETPGIPILGHLPRPRIEVRELTSGSILLCHRPTTFVAHSTEENRHGRKPYRCQRQMRVGALIGLAYVRI